MQLWNTRRTDRKVYFGVLCGHCGEPILFGVDLSRGEGPISSTLRLMLTCPEPDCRQQADYSGAPVSRYRKAEERIELVAETNT